MRAPFSPLLLATGWLSAAWLAAGCASAPKVERPVAAKEPACANDASNPLHVVASGPDVARTSQDPRIESILNQQSADPRLAWVNRQMYQSLHALDVELRREQGIAACEHPESSSPTLEAQAGNGAAAGGGTASGGASAGAGGSAVTASAATAPAASQNSTVSTAAPDAPHSTSMRKTSLSASRGGGNGATAQKVTAGSDNDIVVRRLRKAAEQEPNPTLRAKLWKEYADYRQGLTAK